MKILITGVAGFLGSHLAQKLSTLGHDIIGIDNMMSGYEDNIPKSITFHKEDCCNYEKMNLLMNGIDVVYHCAATAEYIKKRGTKPFNYHRNIEIKNELTPETWFKREI